VIVAAGSNFTKVAEEVTPAGNHLPLFGNHDKVVGACHYSSKAVVSVVDFV
jgi:hypothetical protein